MNFTSNDDYMHNHDRKVILVQRYKLNSPIIFLHHTTFCNLIQMPAWVNIMGHHSSVGGEIAAYKFRIQSPSVYDYFGTEFNKLSVLHNVDSRCTFFEAFGTHHDNIERGLTIFLQTKPNYFVIESEILYIDEEIDRDGRATLNQDRTDTLLVSVIFKDNFYYICPGEENALIYRIHYPNDIFFTSKGHDVIRSLIGRVFMLKQWCVVGEINIVMPKESKPVTNWDKNSDYDISLCVPYPVVSTNTVPEASWCSVQTVRLNDREYVKDVLVNYNNSDSELDESDDNMENAELDESDSNKENEERIE